MPRDDGTDGQRRKQPSRSTMTTTAAKGGRELFAEEHGDARGGARRPRDVRTNDDAREPAGPEHATRVPGVRLCYSRSFLGKAAARLCLSSSRLSFLAPRFNDAYRLR